MANEFWRTFRWFLAFILVFIVVLSAYFGLGLWQKMAKLITTTDWWAQNLVTFIFFTAIVSVVSWLVTVLREKEHQKPFKEWKLVLIYENDRTTQDLHWQEVEHIISSDFERWKMVKSVVSGAGVTSLITGQKAEKEGWVAIDANRMIVNIDKAIKVGHLSPRENKDLLKKAPEQN